MLARGDDATVRAEHRDGEEPGRAGVRAADATPVGSVEVERDLGRRQERPVRADRREVDFLGRRGAERQPALRPRAPDLGRPVEAAGGHLAAVVAPRQREHRVEVSGVRAEEEAVLRVPDAGDPVLAPGGEERTVGAEAGDAHGGGVPGESEQGGAVRAPHADGAVVAGGDDASVGRHLRLKDGAAVLEGSEALAARRVPQRAGRAGGGDHARSVGAEAGGVHARGGRSGRERAELAARARVPDPHRAVAVAGDDTRPVGGERRRPDLARVPAQLERERAVRRSPHADDGVGATGDDARAVRRERRGIDGAGMRQRAHQAAGRHVP